MTIKFISVIHCPFEIVKENFGVELFHHLAPPRFIATNEIYQGEEVGDLIIMRFHFPVSQKWISEITFREETSHKLLFEDRGLELPWGISTWHHKHLVEKHDESTTHITDNIKFTVKNSLLKIPVYIGIYFGFAPRKWKYRSYFSKFKNE